MLDFYRQHQISPVTQDIGDLQAHFQRRAFLYRSLGLPPVAIQGKRVFEVGAGASSNALYTVSLQPQIYTVLEPNPTGAEEIKRAIPTANVVCERLEDYSVNDPYEPFDVVLCEGLLGLCGGDPNALLADLVGHVKVGGVVVITCIDAISNCAEVLRRAMAHRIVDRSKSLQEQVQQLVPVFTPHLATLKGMTRSVEDWILDNLLNPASIGPLFSIPDALTAVDGTFEVLGCSPRFLIDWRWYKEGTPGTSWAIESYWRNCHNLYDYRFVNPPRDVETNRTMYEECLRVRADVQAYERGELKGTHRVWLHPSDIGWFGRGQQYLSLVRVQ